MSGIKTKTLTPRDVCDCF